LEERFERLMGGEGAANRAIRFKNNQINMSGRDTTVEVEVGG